MLVVQVPDKASDAKLAEVVGTIEEEWPDLGPQASPTCSASTDAHARRAHGRMGLPGVHPDDADVRVVLAKEAISTGLGLPAGRGPLLGAAGEGRDAHRPDHRPDGPPAARPPDRDRRRPQLGHLLPAAVRQKALTAHQGRAGGHGRRQRAELRVGAGVMRAPMMFERNAAARPRRSSSSSRRLPSIPTPDRTREPAASGADARAAARRRRGGRATAADAGADLTERLNQRLDGLAAEHAGDVDANVGTCWPPRSPARGSPRSVRTWARSPRSSRIATHARDVARDAQRIINWVNEGAGKAWFAHRLAAEPGADRDARPGPLRRAAARGRRSRATLDAAATEWVKEQLDQFRVQILEHRRARRATPTRGYRSRRRRPRRSRSSSAQTSAPRRRTAKGERPAAVPGPRVRGRRRALPGRRSTTGSGRSSTRSSPGPGFVAWYRNPGSATPASLRIAYQDDEGRLGVAAARLHRRVAALMTGRWRASIVDPHGDHLADARAKLQALAMFAEQFGDRFVRDRVSGQGRRWHPARAGPR